MTTDNEKRLAALLHEERIGCTPSRGSDYDLRCHNDAAARLTARGVTVGLDEERLASILPRILLDSTNNSMADPDGTLAKDWGRDVAAAIAREYGAAQPAEWPCVNCGASLVVCGEPRCCNDCDHPAAAQPAPDALRAAAQPEPDGEDRSQDPRYHTRGCPQHVHPTQRPPDVIAICTCGGVDYWECDCDCDPATDALREAAHIVEQQGLALGRLREAARAVVRDTVGQRLDRNERVPVDPALIVALSAAIEEADRG